MSLLSLDEAQKRLFALAEPTPVIDCRIAAAAGFYAAHALHALRNQPSANLSAMDGYAVRWQDMPGPWSLIGESAAGHPFDRHVGADQAVRVSTGAILPGGSDTVIVQEDIARTEDRISLPGNGPAARHAHVRHEGFDFKEKTQIIAAGDRLTPARVALSILAGHDRIAVHRAVKIAIMDCGDELVAPGKPLSAGQIHASNGAMLAAMLTTLPANIRLVPTAKDTLEAVTAAFRSCSDADIIVTTGGASVGDHDLIRPALTELGADIDFWRVAIKPGKPLMAGKLGNAVTVGLPGNPVSAYVTASLFLLPLVRYLTGASDPWPTTMHVAAGEDLPATGARAEYPRGYYDGSTVAPLGEQDSSALRMLAGANALIVREPNASPVRKGETVAIHLI